jgi:prepilin-type N-terminal cleavage/methylation domain-containing protein
LVNTDNYMRKILSRGFTLVELLIVIGLLGAIALIVIAAINPIEQANRARDARYQADSGQLLSAVERYFASHSSFPWQGCATAGCTTSSESAFGFANASTQAVGLCGASCAASGTLITNDELKTEFLARDWVTATTVDKQIQIGKAQGSSASVYACYIPLAKSTRDRALAEGKVHSLSFTSSGTVATTTACTSASDNWTTNACYVCIP